MLSQPLGVEKVGPTLVQGNDVLVGDFGEHPLLLTPDSRAERPGVAPAARLEETFPFLRGALAQAIQIVLDLQQAAIGVAVDYLIKRESVSRPGALETRCENHARKVRNFPG